MIEGSHERRETRFPGDISSEKYENSLIGRIDDFSTQDDLHEIKRSLQAAREEFRDLISREQNLSPSEHQWQMIDRTERIFKLIPISVESAVDIADAKIRGRLSEIVLELLGRKGREARLVDKPLLRFTPWWLAEGFHECYYVRQNTYNIHVDEDVFAVEIDNRTYNVTEGDDSRSIGWRRFTKHAGFSPKGKYLTLHGAKELIHSFSEGAICVAANGEDDPKIENYLQKYPTIQEITDISELETQGARVQILPCAKSKEDVVKRLHRKVANLPKTFVKMLNNRFEVTRLDLYYAPTYVFQFRVGKETRELKIDATRGRTLK